MSMDNNVVLVGNLTADPELRYTQSGVAVCNVRIAVNRRVKDGDTWKDALSGYFTATVWRDYAENLAESLHRGDRVLITGRLQSRSYEDRDGVTKWVTEIEAEEICPSLRWARATIAKVERSPGRSPNGQAPPPEPTSDDVPF